jgi:hypothetical protein
MRSRTGRIAMLAASLVLLGACVPICGIGAKFSLSNAHVDSQYNCPFPADHKPYEVHATIDAGNTLSNAVTIKEIDESDQLVSTVGDWAGPKTATGKSTITTFQPKSIASGGSSTIKFSVGFECTNSGPTVSTYGDFSFKFAVKTSAGTFTITAGNHHRLNFPVA